MIYNMEELKERLIPVLRERGVRSAVLFGSYSKGEADEKSDVDLLVDSGLRGFKFIGLANDIEAALGKAVDVFDVTHIKPESRMETEIRNSGVRIYG
ncbi:MAG: nucleotidyltransferase domain-containing protein [Clostridiales bacterium]|nr:nucleotidyltransferase domain-containing protein [Clostridiales bacterium]